LDADSGGFVWLRRNSVAGSCLRPLALAGMDRYGYNSERAGRQIVFGPVSRRS
jgi:hypothetical protein